MRRKMRTPAIIAIRRTTTPAMIPIIISEMNLLGKEDDQITFEPFLYVRFINVPFKLFISLLFIDDIIAVVGITFVDVETPISEEICPFPCESNAIPSEL
jgi:hypothetical protein